VRPLVFALPGNEALARALDAEPGEVVIRRFPDGESYVRLETPVAGREVVLACTLDRPDAKLIGPDRESAQWVSATAAEADLPSLVLEKVRRGDREVEVSVPGLERWPGRTPVLVDDIISTGRTMAATIAHLRRLGTPPPVCVAVHAVFAGRAWDELMAAGAARVVTCNTIPHASSAIDLSALVARAVRDLLGRAA
jgi:ribose-phosphate pyrophosphokinase